MSVLIIAALMLLLAALRSSEAACAWVLWVETESTVKKESGAGTLTLSPTWKTVQAESSKSACESARSLFVAALVAAGKTSLGATAKVHRGPSGSDLVVLTYPDSEPFWVKESAEYRCLPDTIDPRGPKR